MGKSGRWVGKCAVFVRQVNLHEAKTHLSRLVEEVAVGEEIVIAKAGRPMAVLTDDGKVYELAGGLAADKNAKIVPHVGHTVEVTGDVMDHDGKMMITADTLKMISK